MYLVIFSWAAILLLSISYWFQIWKIHVHKEVRDISLVYHFLLAIGFGILIFTAYYENSLIFTVKQIATFIPVVVIIIQIMIHKKDHWHDNIDSSCCKCRKEIELDWDYCAYCGEKK